MQSSVIIRRLLAGLAVVVATAALVACNPNEAQIWTTADCAPGGTAFPAPCGSLGHKLRSLVAGDVLKIDPGTYEIGKMRIDNMPGTSGKGKIAITANDAANPPILDGWLALWGADWVTLDNLVFHGTETTSNGGGPAGGLSYICGTNNTVKDSEFHGANETQSLWNLGIGGNKSGTGASNCPNEPSGLTVTGNVFRLPYTDGSNASIYHHIYAFFEGDSGTSATISRNIFHGFKNGAGVKLGTSSVNSAQNVTIEFNTFYDGRRAIVLEDLVKGIVLNGNLIDRIVGSGGTAPHVPIVCSSVVNTTPHNVISHTYVAHNLDFPLMRVWYPYDCFLDGGDNNGSGADPLFNSTDPAVSGSFNPMNPDAQPYGRYGTGAF